MTYEVPGKPLHASTTKPVQTQTHLETSARLQRRSIVQFVPGQIGHPQTDKLLHALQLVQGQVVKVHQLDVLQQQSLAGGGGRRGGVGGGRGGGVYNSPSPPLPRLLPLSTPVVMQPRCETTSIGDPPEPCAEVAELVRLVCTSVEASLLALPPRMGIIAADAVESSIGLSPSFPLSAVSACSPYSAPAVCARCDVALIPLALL